ncbi:LysR substrate-binding domain-containing protein [Phyllobacterium sp. SB3]|uniref:LysR substrate-binding domain-containing protein n=1 Tax=Phyllobacterium sp. SB3 TaxID=3156073 RepID=UPI0032AF8A6D
MELRHLRYFVAVAEEGSITKAAERLHIQQPPLGQQIRLLEEELGVQLFDRLPKRIMLNAAGGVFLEEARAVLARAREAMEHVRRFDRGERGRLIVGFTSSASLHKLTPRILRTFRDEYPLAKIEVEERETYELILALQEKRIDAALLHISSEGFADLESTVLARENMVAAIPRDHPLAANEPSEPVTLAMLAGQDLVIYRRADGPGIFDAITRALDAEHIKVNIVDQVSRLIAAINLVAAGRGVTLVPASIQVLHREAVIYRPVWQHSLPPLPLYAIYRKNNRLALVNNFIAKTIELAGIESTP